MDARTSISTQALRRWWAREVRHDVEHVAVMAKVTEEAKWSAHYVFMVLVSAGIAALGLLLSSPAVIIGAMLLSPMMGPIMGLGFGLALFDAKTIRISAISLIAGIILAVLFSTLITYLSPLQTVTPEIASRTRPTLFDLGVAILSGAAGTYATIRGRHGAIVGVAIAVAVMPPLAVIGFGIASWNGSIVRGASLLFLTNLTAISVAAAVLARVYGFGHYLSSRQGWLQAIIIVLALGAVGVPLSIALRQIAWEALVSREVRDELQKQFGDHARIGDIEIAFDKRPIEVSSVVFTPKLVANAEQEATQSLTHTLGGDLTLAIEQVRVGDATAASSELAAARREDGINRAASRVAQTIGLLAGVPPEQVLVDSIHKIARADAAPLADATIGTYRTLEQRAAAAAPGWTVLVIPPAAPLPEIAHADGDDAPAVIDTIAWAAQRTKLPVGLRGKDAHAVAAALQDHGIIAEVLSTRGRTVRAEWLSPNADVHANGK